VNRFAWVNAKTISEAASTASNTVAHAMTLPPETMDKGETVVVKANGIDILDLLKEGLLKPSRIVSLGDVPDLDDIAEDQDGGLRIGSMTTLATLAGHAIVRQRYPALADAVRGLASPQIRNVATLGGNLLQRPRCWYFRSHAFRCLRKGGSHCFAISGENQYHAIFDNMPCAIVHPSTAATVLVALGASVELTNARGATRTVLLEDFFVSPKADLQRENDLQPREILRNIRLARITPSVRMAHVKQGQRDSFDWPLADVAIVLDFDPDDTCKKASIVLGAAAPVPHRAKAAEKLLTGNRIDERVAGAAAHAALDGATPLGKNAYKLPLFEALVRRATLQIATKECMHSWCK